MNEGRVRLVRLIEDVEESKPSEGFAAAPSQSGRMQVEQHMGESLDEAMGHFHCIEWERSGRIYN